MAGTLKLEIVTPEGSIFADQVEMVTLPGVEGEMGIYPQHVPLMTQLVAGELTLRRNGRDTFMAVGDGFVEITGEAIAILTDMAVNAESIDEAEVERARARAEARLKEKISEEDFAAANAALVQSLTKLQVKRRHR